MNKIGLKHANKSYDKRLVLNKVTIDVALGEILGLIGPSGAGKTTTIKCLMGMEKLDSGEAIVFDTKMPNRKILSRIGYMGQSDALYETLSALENIKFFGEMMNMKKAEIKIAAKKYLSLVNLMEFTKKQVSTYSGGMKRRLSLAITLLSNPDLIVLDEPTVGIDPTLRIEIWDQLRELASKENKSIIVTTHVMDEAQRCDRVGLIIDGHLIALGTPNDLKAQFAVDTIEEVFLKAEKEGAKT